MRWLAPPLVLAACAPKLDPILPMRAELAEARQRGPQDHPHARATVSSKAAVTLVEALTGLDRPRPFPLGFGAMATVRVQLEPPQIGLAREAGCRCALAEVDVRGALDVTVDSLLGSARLADGLGFDGHLTGPLRFTVEGADGGRSIHLVPAGSHRWAAHVQLDEQKGPLTDSLVDQQLASLLRDALGEPVRIATIPADVPVLPARLEALAGDRPEAALWIEAAPVDAPPPAPPSDADWAIATTDAALLAGARAAMIVLDPHPRWKLEPRALTLDDDRFVATLRVHKAARRLKHRDLQVTGRVLLGDQLRVVADEATELAATGFRGSLTGPLVKRRMLRLARSLDVAVPSTTRQPVGERRALDWTLTSLDTTGDTIVLAGRVAHAADPAPPVDSPPPARAVD